jgi:hypothetical protein
MGQNGPCHIRAGAAPGHALPANPLAGHPL